MKKTSEKDFKQICKVLEVFSEIGRIMTIVAAAVTFVAVLASVFSIPDRMEVGSVTFVTGTAQLGIQTPEGLYKMLMALVVMGTAFCVCSFTHSIFKELTVCDTPFKYDIADKIKGVGIVLIGGGILSGLTDGVFAILELAGVIGEFEQNEATFIGSLVFCGVILMALSYVFEYGCKLQEQSDETL